MKDDNFKQDTSCREQDHTRLSGAQKHSTKFTKKLSH